MTVKVLGIRCIPAEYGGPILDANTLRRDADRLHVRRNGDLAVPGVKAEEPIGGLQRPGQATVREDSGAVPGYRLAGTGSLASRACGPSLR